MNIEEFRKELKEELGIAIGEASMCWSEMSTTGVFDSERAAKIVNRLDERIGQLLDLLEEAKEMAEFYWSAAVDSERHRKPAKAFLERLEK